MIQRIQTLYLLLALALITPVYFFDLGIFNGSNGVYALRFWGLVDVNDLANPNSISTVFVTWSLAVLSSLIGVLLLFTIFFYKKRVLQIRICGILMGLEAGLSALIYFTNHSIASKLDFDWSFNLIGLTPLVAIVATLLAIRAIGRDEALVKSLDRIR